MRQYTDTLVVGVATFLFAMLVLAAKPFYTPVEVSDEARALSAGEISIEEPELGEVIEEENLAGEVDDVEGDSETFEAEDQIADPDDVPVDEAEDVANPENEATEEAETEATEEATEEAEATEETAADTSLDLDTSSDNDTTLSE